MNTCVITNKYVLFRSENYDLSRLTGRKASSTWLTACNLIQTRELSGVTTGILGRVARQRPSRFIYCQGGRRSASLVQLIRPDVGRPTDVPDWATTSAVQATFWELVTVLMISAMVASWHPTRCNLKGGGSVWDVAVHATQPRTEL